MSDRSRRAVAATGIVAVAACVLAACSGTPARPPTQQSAPSRAATAVPGGPSPVPRTGALLGAYVQPAAYTSADEIAAVQTFENQIGRPLAIVHVYHPWNQPFPSRADRYFVASGKTLLLTWSGHAVSKQIISGKDDALIRARAEALKGLKRPIMLEFRHEMDRPNLEQVTGGPAEYIRAWDHVRSIFAEVGADNVSWVWCPTGWGFQDGRAEAFYPGDNEVNWICADVYASSPQQSLAQAAAPFLKWAHAHPKPVIIGEFAAGGPEYLWPAWLAGAGRLAHADTQIKAMVYFDGNGTDSQGRPFHYWLASEPTAVSAFASLAKEPYFSTEPRSGT